MLTETINIASAFKNENIQEPVNDFIPTFQKGTPNPVGRVIIINIIHDYATTAGNSEAEIKTFPNNLMMP